MYLLSAVQNNVQKKESAAEMGKEKDIWREIGVEHEILEEKTKSNQSRGNILTLGGGQGGQGRQQDEHAGEQAAGRGSHREASEGGGCTAPP